MKLITFKTLFFAFVIIFGFTSCGGGEIKEAENAEEQSDNEANEEESKETDVNTDDNVQRQLLASRNNDGTYEYLHFSSADNSFLHSTSEKPEKVTLKTIKVSDGKLGKDYEVEFPASKEVYILKTNGATLLCKKSDGTEQHFAPVERYASSNEEGVTEYIEILGPVPVSFVYSSSKNPEKINLKSVGGDMMSGEYKVSFPNDDKVYVLKVEGNKMYNSNPDGTKQTFIKQ